MGSVSTVFIVTLIVNIMLVSFGFNITNFSTDFIETDSTGMATAPSERLIGAVNPENFTASGVNTGETVTDYKIVDSLGVIRTGLSMIVSVLIAPLLMALQLSWPYYLVMLIAVPWTLAFWISAVLLIRGVSG